MSDPYATSGSDGYGARRRSRTESTRLELRIYYGRQQCRERHRVPFMRGVVLGLRLPEHWRRPLTRAGAARVSPVARREVGAPMRPAAFLVAIATWTMVVVSAGCSGVGDGRTPTAT